MSEKYDATDALRIDSNPHWYCQTLDPRPCPTGEHTNPAVMAPATGSTVVTALEQLWTTLRANHPELPAVVMVTGSGFVGPSRWGHHLPEGWTDRHSQITVDGATTDLKLGEMFVAGETLAKGAAFAVETVLHEAAHVLARVRGVQDTSRQQRWHNERFRRLAEELGLEYVKDRAHLQVGFSEMTLTPGARDEYEPMITTLDAAIRLVIDLPSFMTQPGVQGTGQGEDQPAGGEYIPHHGGRRGRRQTGTGPGSNNCKATCGCEPARIIRVSRKVAEQGFIACGLCHQSFELADGTRAGDQPADSQ